MSDSQDELLTRPDSKNVSAAEAEKRGRTVAKNAKIPILDQIVQPSKQKDLADLLIKIIQTNEAEDKKVLRNFDADVSSATLRDIDAKLSAALQKSSGDNDSVDELSETQYGDIPMLTEIAEFPVNKTSILEFPTSASRSTDSEENSNPSSDAPIFEFPATAHVGNETAAANSSNAPQSANQDNVPRPVFSFADDAPNWSMADDIAADLSSAIESNGHDRIEELVEEHARRMRKQLDQQINEMKRKLLSELLHTPPKED